MADDSAEDVVRDRRWEADVVPLALSLDIDPAARPVAVLIVSDDQVLHSDVLTQAPAEPEQVAALLSAPLRRVSTERGALPKALWVRHEGVRDALAKFPDFDSVRIAATPSLPALDPAVVSLLQHLTGERQVHRISGPDTWRGWGLPNAQIAKLFEAAAEFYRAAPWRWLTNEQLLYARIQDGREWAVCILGNGGCEFGLALYADPEDFFRQVGALSPEQGIDELQGELVSLLYCNQKELPRQMLKEVTAKGWEVAGVDAYPAIFPVNTPGGGVTRRHAHDMNTLLRLVPRFVEQFREILQSQVSPEPPIKWLDETSGTVLRYEGGIIAPEIPIEWLDEDDGTYLGYESGALAPDIPLWPPLRELGLALPTGPAADPLAALQALDIEVVDEEHHRVLDRFRIALEDQGMGTTTVKRHTTNVFDFLHCIAGFQGIPLRALTEYDLRTALYDWYLRKMGTPITYVRAMPTSLKRFFDFTKRSMGLEFPWAGSVLKERDELEERWATFPGGFWWDEEVQEWQADLNTDLHARVFLSDINMEGGEEWGSDMRTVESRLSNELQRRWLLWREDVISSGLTEPAEVRAKLVQQQRDWECTPHPAHGGATPVEAVLQEREESPF